MAIGCASAVAEIDLLDTERSRATTHKSHAVMMPPDVPMASKATKEDVEEGKNVAALNDEGEVSLVSWRQITPQVSPDEVALHVRALVRVP
jgi:hypothetical protein